MGKKPDLPFQHYVFSEIHVFVIIPKRNQKPYIRIQSVRGVYIPFKKYVFSDDFFRLGNVFFGELLLKVYGSC